MNRVLIDACVLYPTVLREIVTGVAATGAFTPLWSERILEEWARAAARRGDAAEARAAIAVLRDRWPDAMVTAGPVPEGLWLPDPHDIHVLAAAIAGRAETLLTLNLQDFPTRVLSAHGILRRDPDGFLCELHATAPERVENVVASVHETACTLSGQALALRPLLKRARLPRLGKRLVAPTGAGRS